MTNEKVMILTNRLKRTTATWWLFGTQWKVVGAMKPLSRLVCDDPARSASNIEAQGYEFIWRDGFNPAAPGAAKPTQRKQRKARRTQPHRFQQENEQIAKWRKYGTPGYAQF